MIATWRLMLAAVVLCGDPSGVFLQQVCPTGCKCRPMSGYDYCSDQNFTRVPDNLTTTGTTLDLENNRLSVIRNKEFFVKGGVNIDTLFLGHNNISQLEDEAFNGLANLTSVYLHNNGITVFNKDIFKTNLKMKFLHLGHNSLTVPSSEEVSLLNSASLTYLSLVECNLSRLTRGFFSETPNIINLYLHYNKLSVLNWSTFKQLNRLEDMYIEVNAITSVMCEPELVLSLSELYYAQSDNQVPSASVGIRYTSLELSENPLQCDCCLYLTTHALKKRFKYVGGSCTNEEGDVRELSAAEESMYLKHCFVWYMKELHKTTVGDEEERKIKEEKEALEVEVHRIESEKSKVTSLYQKLQCNFDRQLNDKFAAEFAVVVAKWVLIGVGAVMTVIGTAVLVLRWRDQMSLQQSDANKNIVIPALPPSEAPLKNNIVELQTVL